ncbi:hypothetical protein SAMN05421640_1577 [Ekhidna lutea]|uniref:Uncharacterized protein n=1 Tax=Ekhidna lutea TaxID=447679 RepID=A0A239I078_EKHLU|nr:hypothetical protein [Ekhidna lutea]SNS86413.1 hypothetical protein SAMN05421640_1577 [Ekhidna lutea]
MRIRFSLLFLSAALTLSAQQFSSEVFHEGFLVTTDKDTIKGDLKYDLDANLLSVIYRGKTMSFSSHKVFYFEIFDKILNNYRQFYSIPYTVNIDYKIPVFFELVYEGKLSLMAREHLVSQVVNSSSAYWGGGSRTQTIIKYSYYFMDDKGKITFFTGKKRDLLDFMVKKQSHVKKFIKDNRLDTDEMADLIRITAFYNSI